MNTDDDAPERAPLARVTPSPTRLERTLLTGALVLAALAGNWFSLPVSFGIDFLFGSIAVMLALAWLGTGAGVFVALVGGAYTWLLWGHPYSLLIFVTEAAAVGWHRERAGRRGLTVPPLAVSAALYWLVLGAPLSLLAHRFALGLGWAPTLLIVIKQIQNGILNAALADLILVVGALLTRRQSTLPLAQVLFGVLLAAMLVPTLLLNAWENRGLKDRLEAAQADRLRLFGELAVHQLVTAAQDRGQDPAAREAQLRVMRETLAEDLPAAYDPRLRLEQDPAPVTEPQAPQTWGPGKRPEPGQPIPTTAPGLSLILPGGHFPTRVALWRAAVYRMETPAHATRARGARAPADATDTLRGWRLVMEVQAAPLVDEVQEAAARRLVSLLAIALLGLVIASRLSRRIVRPLQALADSSRALPAAIREDRPWPAPVPGLLAETGALADTVSEMARSLAASFRTLRAERDRREALNRALFHQEERYRLVVENIEDLLLRVDAQGRFEYVSPSYCRTFGRSESELIGRIDPPPVHPDDRAATAAAVKSLFQPPHTFTIEHRTRTVRGWRWFQWSDRAVLDARGQVIGIVAVGRDVTERNQAEQALQEGEQRFRTLFETMAEGVLYRDEDGTITDANPAALRLLGQTPEGLVGTGIADLPWQVLREDGTELPAAEHPAMVALRTGRDPGEAVMGILNRASGDTRWMLVHACPEVRPGASRPYRVFTTFADITRLKQTEQRLQTLIDVLPHGIVEADPHSRRLLWCSAATLDLFGYGPTQWQDLKVEDLHPVESRPLVLAEFARMAQGDLAPGPELPARRRDGSTFYCKVSPGLIRLGRDSTLVAFLTDVTTEREARLALERSQELLLKSQELARLGSWEFDIASGAITWSPEEFRIFEQDPEHAEPGYEGMLARVHPEHRALLDRVYRESVANRTPCELMHRLLMPDGRVKWVHERGETDYALDGRPLRTRGTTQDITDRKVAELALADQRRRLANIIAATQVATWEWELQTGQGTVNERWAEIIGYRLAELAPIGLRTWTDVTHPDDLKLAMDIADRHVRGETPGYECEMRMRHKDGHWVWVLAQGRVVEWDAAGTPLRLSGINQDISERRRAQQALRESEERFVAIFDHAPIGMALLGRDGRIILANRALATFVGRTTAGLVGMGFEELGHADERDENLECFADLMAGRRTAVRMTRCYPRPDGGLGWGDLRMTLLPSRPDAAPLPLGMVEDITELHAATRRREALEATLTRYNVQLEELVDVISLPLPPADQVSTLLWLGCHSLGVVAAVLVRTDEERGHRVLFAARDDTLNGVTPTLNRALIVDALTHLGSPCVLGPERLPDSALAAGLRSCAAMAFACPRPDGQTDTLILSLWGLEPSLDLDGPGRQIIRLIAQRIAAVRYQEQAQQDLVRAKGRESIGHLASGVAHDFNNLLGVIDANVYYIEARLADLAPTDPELRQVMEETQSALGQAKVVTSGMLSLSRAGGAPLEPVDLAPTVTELERILRQVLPAGIALRVAVAPGIKAWTNGAFLQSALLNLALNARDAMSNGGTLTIAAQPIYWDAARPLAVGALPPMDCIALRVSDTGSGIAPNLLPRIFDPLFSTKAKQRGHGLGLFMVQEFINRSGAGLTVESSPDTGTSFCLLLPHEAPATAPVAADPRPAATDADDGAAAPLAGLRVLVVEDDPRVREAVGRLLTLDGARLGLAEHGQACLEALERDEAFDLVLSDIAMPVLDGIALQRRLVQERPGLPIIFMTGQKDALSALDDLPERPTVLRKPLDPAALRRAILAKTGAR